MASKPKKYIFINGVMTLNPEYFEGGGKEQSSSPSSSSSNNNNNLSEGNKGGIIVVPLAIVSSELDARVAREVQAEQGGVIIEEEFPFSTITAIQYMQTEEYRSYFPGDSSLFEELCHYFIIYEVPIGLITKLLVLKDYRLNFMVDDSGSMRSHTDVKYSEATEYVRTGKNGDQFLTRWEEAENRLHIIIDILAYIPAKHIQICFMNNKNHVLILSQQNKTPKMFQQEYHELISKTFKSLNLGGTPTLATLKRGFQEASLHQDPTSHYLLTDGVPSDASVHDVSQLILHRAYPQRNPLTLISCTNVDHECEWMKEIEELAPYTAEIDDYNSERAEVMHDQGPAFPYTKGLWLLSNIIAALNPDDLDALDENIPFTKYTLDELLGRNHTAEEYAYYFQHNPHSRHYRDLYDSFLTVKQPARLIIPSSRKPVPLPSPSPSSSDSGCLIS